jgi:hypothetical protein
VATDDPEVRELLLTIEQLLDAMRRLAELTERLAARSSLNLDERRHVTAEIDDTLNSVDQLQAMLTLRRQRFRPM